MGLRKRLAQSADGQRRDATYAEGSIKYAQPDKGLFHVEKLVSDSAPNQPGGQPQEIVAESRNWASTGFATGKKILFV